MMKKKQREKGRLTEASQAQRSMLAMSSTFVEDSSDSSAESAIAPQKVSTSCRTGSSRRCAPATSIKHSRILNEGPSSGLVNAARTRSRSVRGPSLEGQPRRTIDSASWNRSLTSSSGASAL